MSKFPAAFLSHHEVGKRVRVTTKSGAVIEDVLTQVTSSKINVPGGKVVLGVSFENVSHTSEFGRGGTFELDPESMVKRVDSE